MAKLYHRRNQKTGVVYVYSIERCYWDKTKKSPRNKQIFLGRLNAETGEIIPAKKRHTRIESEVSGSMQVADPRA